MLLRQSVIAVAFVTSIAAASARTATLGKDVFACTEWAGWHEYTLASLTLQGARPSKHCPTRISAGARVDVLEESDESGAATVKYKGRTWVIDGDSVN